MNRGRLRAFITLRRVAALCALLVVLALATPGTTTVAASTYVYDAPALTRADANESALAESGQWERVGGPEGSVSSAVEAPRACMVSTRSFVATEAVDVEGGLPKLGVEPNFQNPAEVPGSGWEWRGDGDPGSSKGSWYNPESGESLHPDLGHPDPIGPQYDWKAPNGVTYRVYPDGMVVEK